MFFNEQQHFRKFRKIAKNRLHLILSESILCVLSGNIRTVRGVTASIMRSETVK